MAYAYDRCCRLNRDNEAIQRCRRAPVPNEFFCFAHLHEQGPIIITETGIMFAATT